MVKKELKRKPKSKGTLVSVGTIVWRLKATIVIALILIVAYFFFSQGNLFIEKGALLSMSFSAGNPFNIISYMLAHMSIWHLIVNVVSLVLFATIVELALSSKDVVGIFLFSAILTVLFFSVFNPGIVLIGASAGVWGIMAASFILNTKRTIAALAIIVALFLFLFPAAAIVVQQYETVIVQKNVELETALVTAVKTGNQERAASIAVEKSETEKELKEFGESKKLAAETIIDPFLHSYAAIFGIVYLFIFRRKETKECVRKQRLFSIFHKTKS